MESTQNMTDGTWKYWQIEDYFGKTRAVGAARAAATDEHRRLLQSAKQHGMQNIWTDQNRYAAPPPQYFVTIIWSQSNSMNLSITPQREFLFWLVCRGKHDHFKRPAIDQIDSPVFDNSLNVF